MAKIQCVDSTRVTSDLTNSFSPTVRTTDPLTFVVEYGETFRVPLAMNALYQPLREVLARLQGWSAAVATRVGWQHLTAYLAWAGSAAWTAAMQGQTERLAIRDLCVDYEQGPAGLWMIGAADFQGTWAASVGVDLLVL